MKYSKITKITSIQSPKDSKAFKKLIQISDSTPTFKRNLRCLTDKIS